MKKHLISCPQCQLVVELDSIHSGGVILWRCCNCHHLIEDTERETLTAARKKEMTDAAATTY